MPARTQTPRRNQPTSSHQSADIQINIQLSLSQHPTVSQPTSSRLSANIQADSQPTSSHQSANIQSSVSRHQGQHPAISQPTTSISQPTFSCQSADIEPSASRQPADIQPSASQHPAISQPTSSNQSADIQQSVNRVFPKIHRLRMNQQQQGRKSSLCSLGENCSSFQTDYHHRSRTYKLLPMPGHTPTHLTHLQPHLFPTVDVPDHAHYIIGSVILLVGMIGMLGNALVIYVFCRSRTLQSPSNLLVVNLAVADFLMSLTQSPVFFVASLHRRWVFGELACELYAFCGALFGITSMMTLTAIAVDRCLAITRPLALLGGLSRGRVLAVLTGVWLYSLGWSLPPFFGWSAYVPEGLQTSCSWDYMSFTATVRAYTILLFSFVFFIPLGLIASCYFAIFRAVRRAGWEMKQLNSGETFKAYERLRGEWRLAKVALGVILLFIISWSPYSAVALTATAGYAHLLTPYMNSVPAVIAKASAIHNPIIYAITHPKYRAAIGRYIPLLRPLLRLQDKDLRSSLSSSGALSRRATLISQSSPGNRLSAGVRTDGGWRKSRLSSVSDSESCWTESEADGSGVSQQVSSDVTADITSSTAPTVDSDSPDGGTAAEGKPLLPL